MEHRRERRKSEGDEKEDKRESEQLGGGQKANGNDSGEREESGDEEVDEGVPGAYRIQYSKPPAKIRPH